MGVFVLIFVLMLGCVANASPPLASTQILYLLHKQEIQEAFNLYLQQQHHDPLLLEQMCMQLITSGINTPDKETQLLSIFGAGISEYAPLMPILKKGIQSDDPELQMTSLHFLRKNYDDHSLPLIRESLSSPFLGMRLEALFTLAIRQDPSCIDHLFSLVGKIPPSIVPLLSMIAAQIDHPRAKSFLVLVMQEFPNEVKMQTLLQLAAHHRDDLLKEMLMIAKQSCGYLQEAAMVSLGMLEYRELLPWMHAAWNTKETPLPITYAYYLLGENTTPQILQAAQNKDCFAIALLSMCHFTEEVRSTLLTLLKDPNQEVSINAAYTLCKHKDPSGIEILRKVLLEKSSQEPLVEVSNHSHTLRSLQHVSLTHPNDQNTNVLLQYIMQTKLQILETISLLPHSYLLGITQALHDAREYALVLHAVNYLSHIGHPDTLAYIQHLYHTTPSELVKLRISHILYQHTHDPKLEEELLCWIKKRCDHHLFSFQTSAEHQSGKLFKLTPSEISEILVSALETLAQEYNQHVLETIIYAIAHGHVKNRYALAGLVLRMLA